MMLCLFHTPQEYYEHRLSKTRENVLNHIYKTTPETKTPKKHDNLRLRLRFKEAIQEAQEICYADKTSNACHVAWGEVDELEDSILRLYPDRW